VNIQDKEDFVNNIFENLINPDDFRIKNDFSTQFLEFMSILSENVIWLIDKNFNFTYVSQNIESLSGLSPEEFCKNGIRKNVSTNGLQMIIQLKRYIQSGELNTNTHLLKLDLEQIKKDKTKTWTEVAFHPFYRNQQYIGTIGFTREIENRKKTEIELVKNKNRYLTFFESSPVCLWECDFSLLKVYLNSLRPSVEDNLEYYLNDHPEEVQYCFDLIKVQEANHTTLSTYGVDNQKEFSAWINGACQIESNDYSIQLLLAIDRNKLSFKAEGIQYRKNMDPMNITLKWNVVPGYEDLYKKVIISVTDISEQKKAEAAILKTQRKLKKINKRLKQSIENEKMLTYEANLANNAKNRFLSTMSHEIRTPINGILGISQLLQTTGLNHDQKEYLDIIMSSTNHLVNIVDNIFEYSKVIDEQFQLSNTSFSLFETIVNCTKSLAFYAHQKGLKIYLKWNYSSPNLIEGDLNRVRQIFLYLIDNAIKFTDKGFIQITLHRSSKTENGQYQFSFSVQDTGIGFEDKYAEKIFEPFFQVDNLTYRKYSGTGLGLAMVSQLINLSHGTIVTSSKPGKGSHFFITLPFNVSDNRPVLVLDENIHLKLLFFEEDDKHIEIIETFFEKSNITCIFMSPDRLDSYLEFIKENESKFDFVIINYSKEYEGLQALENHTETILNNNVKIIMLYTMSDQISDRFSLEIPVFAKISLPLDMSELYCTITR